MSNIGGAVSGGGFPTIPLFNSLECFGHSFIDNNPGALLTSQVTTDNFTFPHIFGAAIGLDKHKIVNHGVNGAQLTQVSRGSGFARPLCEIMSPTGAWPINRSGGAYLFCFGINDIGHNTPANQTKIQADFGRCLTAIISKARSGNVYLATNAQWTLGANFSTSPATSVDFTSGISTSKQATVVDSAGTSTATFTIPFGYQGEPICFNMVCLSGGSLIVTWGGTVTGTTSIVGRTDTLSSLSVNAQCAYPVRFTGPVNGLSAANAGQTITVRITTVSGSTFTLDGCWIEAFKPAPVLVCNVQRLSQTTYNLAFGDGVTTGVNTSFTSATAAFATATDAGQAITETDAQGAFTAGKTVSSVTNATTIVLSGNAAAAKTSIQVTLNRKVNGYSASGYSENTNFTGATQANHTAADADIDNMNTQIATTVSQFGSMVQIVDMNTALGNGDTVLPSNVYSWFIPDGLHPNDQGSERIADQVMKAALALRPENDGQDYGFMEIAGSVHRQPGPDRRIINSGQIYLPEFPAWAANYTAVAGDMFAMPMFFTESTIEWGATQIELTNTPTTGSTIRIGIYDDHNGLGYPQCLRQELSFALGTTTGVRASGNFTSRVPHYGLYWLVVKMDTIVATAPQFRAITGPNKYLPNWSTAGGALLPIAWKLTGVATGALPTTFTTGGALTSVSPACSIALTLD